MGTGTARLAFVDTETTGLDTDRHEPWEIAIIIRNPGADLDREFCWQMWPENMAHADPTGLRISRFYERIVVAPPNPDLFDTSAASILTTGRTAGLAEKAQTTAGIAAQVASLLDGRHMVGAVPDFDARILSRWLRRWNQAATWHYHLIDVETLAVGYLLRGVRAEGAHAIDGEQRDAIRLPWDSQALGQAVGVAPQPDSERHTALGDARWARNVYDAVHGTYQPAVSTALDDSPLLPSPGIMT